MYPYHAVCAAIGKDTTMPPREGVFVVGGEQDEADKKCDLFKQKRLPVARVRQEREWNLCMHGTQMVKKIVIGYVNLPHGQEEGSRSLSEPHLRYSVHNRISMHYSHVFLPIPSLNDVRDQIQ